MRYMLCSARWHSSLAYTDVLRCATCSASVNSCVLCCAVLTPAGGCRMRRVLRWTSAACWCCCWWWRSAGARPHTLHPMWTCCLLPTVGAQVQPWNALMGTQRPACDWVRLCGGSVDASTGQPWWWFGTCGLLFAWMHGGGVGLSHGPQREVGVRVCVCGPVMLNNIYTLC